MRRNETILVYGVTGLLVIILLVAVVFGSDGAPRLDAGQAPAKVETARQDLESLIRAPLIDASGKLAKDGDAQATGDPKAPEAEQKPVVADGSSAAALHAPEAAFLMRGPREGDYRKVRVLDGESFSVLMERFGIGQSRREEVVRLNEHVRNLDRLRAGDVLVLPYVDDVAVLEAAKQRSAERGKREPVVVPERGVERGTDRGNDSGVKAAVATVERKVKKGESLWKVASDVDPGNVSQAMARIRELNPGVAFDPLREGTVLRVPR